MDKEQGYIWKRLIHIGMISVSKEKNNLAHRRGTEEASRLELKEPEAF